MMGYFRALPRVVLPRVVLRAVLRVRDSRVSDFGGRPGPRLAFTDPRGARFLSVVFLVSLGIEFSFVLIQICNQDHLSVHL